MTLLPFVVSAVALGVGVGNNYLPTGDIALTEMQVRDVGRHEVLTGLFSRDDWSHPGPTFFYLMAPFYWLLGDASIAMHLVALAINGASVTGMAIVARRRGGPPLMLCTLLGCALLMRTLGAGFLHDPWNNFITVLPFGLLIFLAWALACGEVWALPVAAAVATFLAQTHVGFLALAVPLLLWGTAWLVLLKGRGRDRDGGDDRDGDGVTRRRELIRPGLASGAVLSVLWLPALVDVLINDPSNPQKILRYFRSGEEGGLSERGTRSLGEGWRIVSGQFGGRPEWLTGDLQPLPTGESPFLRSAPTPWLLALVGAGAWVLWHRRRSDGLRLVMTIVVAFLIGVFAVARTVGPAFNYRLRWTWVLAMAAFVVVLWAGWLVIAKLASGSAARVLGGVAVSALVVLSAVNVTAAASAGTPYGQRTSILAGLMPAVVEAVEPSGGEVLVSDSLAGVIFARGLVLELEHRGIDARVPADRAELFGQNRVARDDRVRSRLFVAVDAEVPELIQRPGLRLLARWDSIPPREQRRIERRRVELDADREAGRVTPAEYFFGTAALAERSRAGGTGRYSVAVFLDERNG